MNMESPSFEGKETEISPEYKTKIQAYALGLLKKELEELDEHKYALNQPATPESVRNTQMGGVDRNFKLIADIAKLYNLKEATEYYHMIERYVSGEGQDEKVTPERKEEIQTYLLSILEKDKELLKKGKDELENSEEAKKMNASTQGSYIGASDRALELVDDTIKFFGLEELM